MSKSEIKEMTSEFLIATLVNHEVAMMKKSKPSTKDTKEKMWLLEEIAKRFGLDVGQIKAFM
jgi:hypothetical protein